MNKLICIAPGHGGIKPGAVGEVTINGCIQRLAEKDVVFGLNHNAPGGTGVSNRVGHHLREEGCRTIMTREADCDIQLSERARIAVRNKAGVFVSIHCNSYADSQATGVEVYVHPNQKNRAHILARHILDEILSQPECMGVRDRGVKTARFRVLEGTYAHMPAVLVELPFISNPKEATLLTDRHFREAASNGIASAIRKFTS